MYQDCLLNQWIHSYMKLCSHVLERNNVGNRFAVKKTGKSKSFKHPCCVKSMNPLLEWTQMLSSWEQCFTSLTRDGLETQLIVEPVSRRSHLLLIPSDWAWIQAPSWVCPSLDLPGALSAVPAVGLWSAKWPKLWQHQQVVVAHVRPSVPGTTLPSACCTNAAPVVPGFEVYNDYPDLLLLLVEPLFIWDLCSFHIHLTWNMP